MNTVQVVSIEKKGTSPSPTWSRRTRVMTRSVRSTTSIRAVVSTPNVSAWTRSWPDVLVKSGTGGSRTGAVDRRLTKEILPEGATTRQRGGWVQADLLVL